ncbi:MAG: AMP-binding protein, partial [Myxococcota bacterium]|nr:AMP-binding protein [Myxococcota bacterium]
NVEDLLVPAAPAPINRASAADPCFIQFTSGSTSRPKGVVVTHGNLSANTLCIAGHGLQVDQDDCGVSWLPLYHDMGLIGFVLAPLFYHQRIVSLAPLTFLKHPHRWLEAISRHRGTISFAPNFAYGLCTRRIRDRHLEGLDLSSWKVAGCGAEPIRYETMRAFAERFEGAGFDAEALYATYGMAEATLAVSFGPVGRGVVRDKVDLDILKKEHRAAPPATTDAPSLEVVGCGRAFPDHDISIVDEKGEALPERTVGEVVVQGPSITPGYMGNQEATDDAIRKGWLHTGDLGYMVGDELFVCGRKKELIIVGGKNYYPQDIEQAVWDVPSVRTGNVIAFGVPGGQGEELVVALETRGGNSPREEVSQAVRQRVS